MTWVGAGDLDPCHVAPLPWTANRGKACRPGSTLLGPGDDTTKAFEA